MSGRTGLASCAGLAVIAALLPRVSAAQEAPEESARRELIAQADVASQTGDHARALELARRAASLRPSPSLTAFLAREHQQLDQRVEALDLARACLRDAALDASLRNRETIVAVCESVRADVEPRVGRLELRVADAPAGLVVRVGERAVLPALFGVPVPVMPGSARVVAEAPGRARFERDVAIEAGALATVDVALAPAVVVAPPAVVIAPPRVVVTPPRRPAPASPGVGPWVLGGVGVVGLALAGVFYGLATGARGERDAACPVPERCPTAAAGALADARDDAYGGWLTGTNVAIGVGAAAVAGAAVWYLVARVTGARAAAPTAVGSPGMLRLGVAF